MDALLKLIVGSLFAAYLVGTPLFINSWAANRWRTWVRHHPKNRGRPFWIAGAKLTGIMVIVNAAVLVATSILTDKVFVPRLYLEQSMERPLSRALDFTPFYPLTLVARYGGGLEKHR